MKRAIRVLHLFDSTIGWDQRLALEQLLDRLPAERCAQHLVSLGPWKGEVARIDAPVTVVPRRFHLDFLVAPHLRRLMELRNINVVHAWGEHAVNAALTTDQAGASVVASVFDPAVVDQHSRMFRVGGGAARAAAICATEIVRRRALERGLSPDGAVLVRPGVNFATINHARKSDLRARLGLVPEAVMLLTAQPASRAGGHFSAFWATAVRSFLEPGVRVVIPGCGREAARLGRLARAVPNGDVLILPGEVYRYEELVAVADGLLMPGATDSSVTAIAWAMAAGVPVVATATPATAELLSHNHNAFLIKPAAPRPLAMRFADAIGRRNGRNKLTETARGQAYEVFSLGRYIGQVQRVYENLVADRPPATGLEDPAVVA